MLKIIKFSFIFLFTLNKTNIPIPDPVNKPPISIPVEITPDKYISVINILDAQLGIKPIKQDINGPKKLSFKRKVLIFSSPNSWIKIFKIKVVIKINKLIFKVWIKLYLKIPFSQWQLSSSQIEYSLLFFFLKNKSIT